MRVLYVEDNAIDVDLATRKLARNAPHIKLECVTNLAAARKRLTKAADFDVLLVDLKLPDGSGLELLTEVREQSIALPVVILTGLGDEETAVAALRAGATDYIAKRTDYLDKLPLVLEDAAARFRAESILRSRKLRVLYSERNAADLDLTRRHLARHAPYIHIEEVATAVEALSRLPESNNEPADFEVLMLDYRLPGMNALEALKEVVQTRRLDLPVVLVTGHGDEDVASQALRLGAADYLVKNPGYLHHLPKVLENAYNRAQLKREQVALRESEERFRLLAENARDIIYRIRFQPGPAFEYISPAVTEILGYSRRELYNETDLARLLVHPDDLHVLQNAIESQDDLFAPMVMRVVRKDGRVIWTELRNTPLFDDDGNLILMEGIARDITNQKQLETAEREQRTLAEALLDTIAAINSTLELNEVLERILVSIGLVINHDGANIMLLDTVDNSMRVVRYCDCYAKNDLPQPVTGVRQPWSFQSHMRDMVERKRPLAIPDTHEYKGWQVTGDTAWIRSFAGAPICIDGACIGVINLDSRLPGTFSDREADILQAFSNQAAIALRNAQLYTELGDYSAQLERAVEERTAELRQSKERVETILNNSPDAVLLLNSKGAIQVGNPAFMEQFGYAPDEAFRMQPMYLIEPQHREKFEELLKQVLGERMLIRTETRAIRIDGTSFDADIAMAPIVVENTFLGIVCTVRDISKLKEVQRMKDAFVSNVSHELRTPITSLKLYHGLLDMRPERRPIYMERLGRELDRLNMLIEDLLRLSRLDQGNVSLNLKTVNLNDLAQQYVEDRRPLAESREQLLTTELAADLPAVNADYGLLGQSLSVLLTNALNYTPVGGKITVSTQTQQLDGITWAGFCVKDTGPGIEREDLEQLFERFFRGAVGRESGAPGTGLGLAIAKEIVGKHNGRIEVSSEGIPGKGAVFTVWLPAKTD